MLLNRGLSLKNQTHAAIVGPENSYEEGAPLRGSAVVDGDAVGKIEGIVEGE
jgi:hypothetical protein